MSPAEIRRLYAEAAVAAAEIERARNQMAVASARRAEIVERLLAAGVSGRAVADRLGISPQAVSNLRARRSAAVLPAAPVRRPAGPCPCECNSGGFCGGCGHAGCGGRR